jgi:copper(I)-binding protein
LYSITLCDNIAQVYLILSDFIKMLLIWKKSTTDAFQKVIRSMKLSIKNIAISLICLSTLLTACAPASKPLASQNGIEIYQASIRILNGDMPAAGYMLIKNTGAINDRLVSVRADFAEQFMLHQSAVDGNGVATMNMVMSIDVPAGQTVELKPGGFHVLIEGLKPGLKVGDSVTLLLQFERAGVISVQAQLTGQ